MTTTEFITALEGYYGMAYSSGMEIKLIRAYTERKTPDELESLFGRVIAKHSKNFRSLPDIAIFTAVDNDIGERVLRVRAEGAWQSLLKGRSADDMLIVDPVAFFVVAGYGSWFDFCEARGGDYREVTHKDFIKRYVEAASCGVSVTPRRLSGMFRIEYGDSFEGIELQIVGDAAEAQKLLNQSADDKPLELPEFITRV